ncbi:MAG: hypothetical protein A2Z18_06385 [Armatimonadetes bacterium RBG_16_58_9]|nr:MAG: hypothetical protein A2Z18_06385 [Armatimonadetes bacterium RBG_16_58_9]
MVESYAYNGYDSYVPTGGASDAAQRHYATDWAPDVATVQSGGLPPHGVPDTLENAQQDYERQLKFRTPPEDTVVTWCSWHEPQNGKALVLFLDGSVDSINGADVEQSRWRTRPRP